MANPYQQDEDFELKPVRPMGEFHAQYAVAAGVYTGEVVNVVPRQRAAKPEWNKPVPYIQYEFVFRLVLPRDAVVIQVEGQQEIVAAEEGVEVLLKVWVNEVESFSTRSKLILLLQALGAANNEEIVKTKKSQWLELRCRLTVEEVLDSKNGAIINNRITGYAPIRRSPVRPAAESVQSAESPSQLAEGSPNGGTPVAPARARVTRQGAPAAPVAPPAMAGTDDEDAAFFDPQ